MGKIDLISKGIVTMPITFSFFTFTIYGKIDLISKGIVTAVQMIRKPWAEVTAK